MKTRYLIKACTLHYWIEDVCVNIQNEVYTVLAKFKQNAWSQVIENAGNLLHLQPRPALNQGFYEFRPERNRRGVLQFLEERVSCPSVKYYEGDQSVAGQPPRNAFSNDFAGKSEYFLIFDSQSQLNLVQEWYSQSFKELCEYIADEEKKGIQINDDTLAKFCQTLKTIQHRHNNVVQTMAQGVLELKDTHKVDNQTDMNIQYFLDRFYMSRISLRMLLHQVWQKITFRYIISVI